MGTYVGEQVVEIAATPEHCFETIVDYESFPRWQQAVQSVRVISRYGEAGGGEAEGGRAARGKVVEFKVDAKFRKVTYRLRYHYDFPGRIWWDFVEGDGVEDVEGEYLLEPAGDRTLATYRLGIDAGIPIPGLIARKLNGQVLKRAAEDLKREAERRVSKLRLSKSTLGG